MRILFVVPYVPNLVRVRSYQLIRHLTARGHQVTVLTLWSNEQERADATALAQQCEQVIALHLPRWRSWWNSLRALPTAVPLQATYAWQPELARQLRQLTQLANGKHLFDLIHVEHLRGVRYGLYYRQNSSRQNGLPLIWDSVDSISHLFRQTAVHGDSLSSRWLARLELERTERYEGWLTSQFDQTLVTSPTDKTALEELSPGASPPIHVLSNGVDLSYFWPSSGTTREAAGLVISGKMSYHANVSMALYLLEAIMPHVWARRPETQVTIVGKDPPRRLRAAAQNPNVTVTGEVADIRPYLRRAAVAVAPILYGAGIQNKVLEAMACATPVVATPQAVSALRIVPGQEALVAEQPAAIAEAILSLLASPEQRYQVGAAGRRYVEQNHQWSAAAGCLESIYKEAVCTHQHREQS
jgi:polysaccharide biosynthesis protein PslH